MTDLARGARPRRGGRRPGWLLLTALLVLAIVASSTLVFTNRVELLRLAVILSLWAAVLAAFVSVIYRRQSQSDQARAREMKFVYDLQLDREISARREYELSVEAHLRRQLVREMRAEAADEMAALRTELVALRANLEMLLGTDLGERPALESDREPVAETLTMSMPPPPGRVESSRITATVVSEDVTSRRVYTEEITAEVAEEIAEEVPHEAVEEALQRAAAERAAAERAAAERAAAERAAAERAAAERAAAERAAAERAAAVRAVAERAAAERFRVPPEPVQQGSHRRPEPPPPPWRPPETGTRRGRHWNAEGTSGSVTVSPPRGRHWVEQSADQTSTPTASSDGGGRRRAPEPAEEAVADADRGQHAEGASVADLMARLQPGEPGGQPPAGQGGGRRRRDD